MYLTMTHNCASVHQIRPSAIAIVPREILQCERLQSYSSELHLCGSLQNISYVCVSVEYKYWFLVHQVACMPAFWRILFSTRLLNPLAFGPLATMPRPVLDSARFLLLDRFKLKQRRTNANDSANRLRTREFQRVIKHGRNEMRASKASGRALETFRSPDGFGPARRQKGCNVLVNKKESRIDVFHLDNSSEENLQHCFVIEDVRLLKDVVHLFANVWVCNCL